MILGAGGGPNVDIHGYKSTSFPNEVCVIDCVCKCPTLLGIRIKELMCIQLPKSVFLAWGEMMVVNRGSSLPLPHTHAPHVIWFFSSLPLRCEDLKNVD